MAIKKWYADADASITNAYKTDITTRGTGSNSGASDSLEVFKIHGQKASGGADASELSRIVLHFSASQIKQAVTDGEIPANGAANAPSFYLRLYNAKHPHTLPQNFTLEVHELNRVGAEQGSTFTEGTGLDMENYRDEGAVSWADRNNTANVAATGTITVGTAGTPGSGPSANFTVTVDGITVTVPAVGGNNATTAGNIVTALTNDTQTDVNGKTIANKINAVQGGAPNTHVVTLTADDVGAVGNYPYSTSIPNVGSLTTAGTYMTGGLDRTAWTTAGGDFNATVLRTQPDGATNIDCSQLFVTGDEDLIIDITDDVRTWIAAGTNAAADIDHPGYIIKLPAGDETALTSIYTKRFFSRSSQYFYKRPCIEARWDDTISDDRSKVYAGHPNLTVGQNAQSLCLYNSVGGTLQNFTLANPANTVNDENVYVRFYRDADMLNLASFTLATDTNADGVMDASTAATEISTASPSALNTKTGVYTANFIMNETGSIIYEKWFIATPNTLATPSSWTILHTGSFALNQRTFNQDKTNQEYILDMTNLKSSYSRNEVARFRLYTRLKDWSPTIYTVASKAQENHIVDQAYYKIFRVVDDETIIDYGIGDTAANLNAQGKNSNHTKYSYDASGSYFDFDMSLLESGYMYGIKTMFVIDGEKKEQPEVFKFRVD